MSDQSQHRSEFAEFTAAINSLRDEVRALENRITMLERSSTDGASVSGAPATETIDPSTVMAIAAAVAAFLGERPHIRQIRLVSGPSWVQSGRATIQASHELTIREK